MAKMRGKIADQKHFKVTRKNCEEGCRNDGANCMIAKAILEAIPHATHFSCTLREISWSDPIRRERNRFFTPPSAAKALIAYDDGEYVEPFALHLNDGVTFPMGWRAKHPGSTRKGKRYKRTGKAGVRYTRYRSFGAHNIKDADVLAAEAEIK